MTTQDDTKLLPCPFCSGRGGTVRSLTLNASRRYVECYNCGAKGPYMRRGAIDAWNTRANERLQSEDVSEHIRALVDKQAEDEGLWFIAATAPEAYLQQELRKLHAVIEDDKLFDGKTCQASDEYIRGWDDSRAFSAKMERVAKEIDAPDDNRYSEGYQDAVREMQDGWISVDERLPEKHVDVLAYVKFCDGYKCFTAWRETSHWDSWGWDLQGAKITHWRPLPEGPK